MYTFESGLTKQAIRKCQEKKCRQEKKFYLLCTDVSAGRPASISQPNVSKRILGHSWQDYWARYHPLVRRERDREWVRVSVQHSLLVFMSRAACLSRFALIKDKGSLIGCRCSALMSITPPLTPPPPHTHTHYFFPAKTYHRHTSAHLSFDALQHLPNISSPCSPPVTHPPRLIHISQAPHITHRSVWGTKATSEHTLFNEIVFLYWYSFPGLLNPIELSNKTSKPHLHWAFQAG